MNKSNFPLILKALEENLIEQIRFISDPLTDEYHKMLTYHMGWSGDGNKETNRGKRIRPLLLLLVAMSGEQNYIWQDALPCASAVELIHNFSLIHDDIQDSSPLRRNRPTLWKKWGVPQAINAGDGLFALASLSALDLSLKHKPEVVVKIITILQNTCLNLTKGQFLDMSFETSNFVTLDIYRKMIEYKTADLLATSIWLGALLAGFSEELQKEYRQFGLHLGMAFQIRDDILGVWGKEAQTGKSSSSDIVSRKKTYPIIYGLTQSKDFFELWNSSGQVEVAELKAQLEIIDAKRYSEEFCHQETERAIELLEKISPRGEVGDYLRSLVSDLATRTS